MKNKGGKQKSECRYCKSEIYWHKGKPFYDEAGMFRHVCNQMRDAMALKEQQAMQNATKVAPWVKLQQELDDLKRRVGDLETRRPENEL